jgi:hypothetical protein
MREPPPPALELFDLDEHFASERARLAQLTNKCGDEDLDYYVRECGNILGISARISAGAGAGAGSSSSNAGASSSGEAGKTGQPTAKDILEHIFRSIVNFKKLNQEPEPDPALLGRPGGGAGAGVGAGAGAASASGEAGGPHAADSHYVPGAAPLRHAIGAAGLGAGVAAGFHSDAPVPAKLAGGAPGGR